MPETPYEEALRLEELTAYEEEWQAQAEEDARWDEMADKHWSRATTSYREVEK